MFLNVAAQFIIRPVIGLPIGVRNNLLSLTLNQLGAVSGKGLLSNILFVCYQVLNNIDEPYNAVIDFKVGIIVIDPRIPVRDKTYSESPGSFTRPGAKMPRFNAINAS